MPEHPGATGEPPTLSQTFARMGAGHGMTSPAAPNQSWPIIPLNSQSVSINQTAKALTMTFLDESGNPTSIDFRPYHLDLSETRLDQLFVCHVTQSEPWLQFFAEPEIRTNIMLLKGVDGSLIVRWLSSSTMGLTVSSVWYRYPLVDTSKSD